jgi:prepilin-type N-terminal cleavage/methylation domain-containing protein
LPPSEETVLHRLSRSLRHRRGLAEAANGFSMIEVLVSMVVFALVASAGVAMLLTGLRSTRNSSYRTRAAGVATQLIEQFRDAASKKCAWQIPTPSTCQVPSVLPPTTQTVPMPPGVTSTAFTATQRTEWEDKSNGTPTCSASGQGGAAGVQPVLAVTETVTWPNPTSKPVTAETVLAPPVGTFGDNTGAITVHVENGPVSKQPVSSASVSITDGSGSVTHYTTDDQGCVFAAYLSSGLYSVSVSKPQYIDTQEAVTSTQQAVSVTSGSATLTTFNYDNSGLLTPTFVAAPSWANPPSPLPTAANLPVTILNSQILSNAGAFVLPNSSGSNQVYPYGTDDDSAYSIWAGQCPDSNPDAMSSSNSPLYPAAGNVLPNPTTVNVYTGQSVSAQVPVYPLTIDRTGGSPTTVTFTLQETSGSASTACTNLHTYGLGSSPPAASSYVVGVPLGTYTLNATDGSSSQSQTVVVGTNGATAVVTM